MGSCTDLSMKVGVLVLLLVARTAQIYHTEPGAKWSPPCEPLFGQSMHLTTAGCSPQCVQVKTSGTARLPIAVLNKSGRVARQFSYN
jgi:hypothetical protein